MMIVILSLNFSTFNIENFIYNTAKENDISGFKMVDDLFYVDENNFNYNKIDRSKYETVNFYDYYITDEFQYTNFNNNNNITNLDFYGENIFNTIIIKDVPNHNIVITDFTADMLINYGIIEAHDISDCINKEIKYKNITLVISNIIETDFAKYNKENIIEDNDNMYYYLESRDNEYTTVFMNKYTMDLLIETRLDFHTKINGENVNILDYRLIDDTSSIALFGELPSADNEIVVSLSFLNKILSISNLDQSDLKNHINKTYNINISNNNLSKQKTYKIVGIIYNDLNLMYLSDDEFINLSQDLEVDLSSLHNKQLYFELGNNEDTTNLIKFVLDNDGYLYSRFSKDIYFTYLGMDSYNKAAKISTLVSFAILTLILIYFTNNLIKQNKKNIGVLSSLGFSKNQLVSIFIWENIKMLMISFVGVALLDYIALRFINQNIKTLLNITINVLNFSFYNLFILLIISLVIVFIASLYPIYMMRKKNLIDIIYDK